MGSTSASLDTKEPPAKTNTRDCPTQTDDLEVCAEFGGLPPYWLRPRRDGDEISCYSYLSTISTTGDLMRCLKENCCASTSEAIGFLICMAALGVLSAMLGVGLLYLQDCPVRQYVPVFLVAAGAMGIVSISLPVIIKGYGFPWSRKSRLTSTLGRTLLALTCLVQLAWWIAGSYWVFSLYGRYQSVSAGRMDYCNDILYSFSFWVLVASYLIALFIVPTLVFFLYKGRIKIF